MYHMCKTYMLGFLNNDEVGNIYEYVKNYNILNIYIIVLYILNKIY